MLVHVVVEQFGIHHVAVAEQEQTVAGAQFGKCFGVLWRKIGHHGVPAVENLIIGEAALQNLAYLVTEIAFAYHALFETFGKSLVAKTLVRLFHSGNAEVIAEGSGEILQRIDLKHIKNTPLLAIKGENSQYIDKESIAHAKAVFSNMTVGEIPNAGHWVQYDQPETFLDVVYKFLTNNKL